MEMKLNEILNSAPINCKSYWANMQEREKIKAIVNKQKDAGIVNKTNIPYASLSITCQQKEWWISLSSWLLKI